MSFFDIRFNPVPAGTLSVAINRAVFEKKRMAGEKFRASTLGISANVTPLWHVSQDDSSDSQRNLTLEKVSHFAEIRCETVATLRNSPAKAYNK